jgi:NADH:ubiquinone oxidoreductase subunit 5 (subunit L)/multisubunit Na+/H+ antiporter MnhA subunit
MTLVLVVAVPLAAAFVILVAGGRLRRGAIGTIGAVAPAFAFGISAATLQAVATGTGQIVADLGPWLPLRGSGLVLRADPSTMPLVLAVTAIATLIAVVALGELPREVAPRFYVALNVLVAATLVLLLAGDLVLLLAAWSVVGVCGAALAGAAGRSADAARDGMVSLVMARLGDAGLLVASLVLLGLFQTLDIDQIRGRLAQILLAPSAERALTVASVLIVASAASRVGLAPFGAWLGDPSRMPAPVAAAVHALVFPTGIALLLRLVDVVRYDVLVLAVALGGATALFAAAASLGSSRVEVWRTAAVLGALVAALGVGPATLVVLLIAAMLVRAAGLLARLGVVSGLGAALVVAAAAVFSAERPVIASALGLAALVLVVGAVAPSRITMAPRVSRVAGAAARLDGWPGLVGRIWRGAMALADRGGEAVIDRALRTVASLLETVSRAARGVETGPLWAQQALLIAASAAIVAYWVVR